MTMRTSTRLLISAAVTAYAAVMVAMVFGANDLFGLQNRGGLFGVLAMVFVVALFAGAPFLGVWTVKAYRPDALAWAWKPIALTVPCAWFLAALLPAIRFDCGDSPACAILERLAQHATHLVATFVAAYFGTWLTKLVPSASEEPRK